MRAPPRRVLYPWGYGESRPTISRRTLAKRKSPRGSPPRGPVGRDLASRRLLQPALLLVVLLRARVERHTQVEEALGGLVVGETAVDLAHAVGVVVERLGQRVRGVVGHLGRDRDGRAHGGGL